MQSKFSSSSRSLALVLLLVAGQCLFAENIRGIIAGVLEADSDIVSFRPEELVVVDSGSVSQYQEGLELQIEIPDALRQFRNSFALLLFKGIAPYPEEQTRLYSGTRIFMRLLPSRETAFVRIPMLSDHTIGSDSITDLLPQAVDTESFPIIAVVLPVVKGIPDTAYDQQMTIRVNPLWRNEGALSVEIANPSEDPEEIITASIDGNTVAVNEAVTVEAGIHTVQVESNRAAPFKRTVAVKPGEVLSVQVTLDYSPPELTLQFPAGSLVFLDGKELQTEGTAAILEIEPGDRQVTAMLGDVQVSRKFTAGPGEKIVVKLIVDFEISIYDGQAGSPGGN